MMRSGIILTSSIPGLFNHEMINPLNEIRWNFVQFHGLIIVLVKNPLVCNLWYDPTPHPNRSHGETDINNSPFAPFFLKKFIVPFFTLYFKDLISFYWKIDSIFSAVLAALSK